MNARDRLIVALDHPGLEPALAQVDRLGEAALFYKVGLELFIAEGQKAVEALRQRGKRVFLDLKLHDIPETVARATRNAAASGADLLTIHASGGVEMMKRAVEAAGQARVLAVTVLTSLDLADLQRDGSAYRSTEEAVVQRARLAAEAGCAGVIASPLEVKAIRQVLPSPFLVVTPGVRRAAGNDDQKRVATPLKARADGADMIVVGRPIRDAADPVAEAQRIVAELG